MTDIRKVLNEELKELKLEEGFAERIMRMSGEKLEAAEGRKGSEDRRNLFPGRFPAAAAVALAILVVGMTATAGYLIRNHVTVNGEAVAGMDELERKMIPEISGLEEGSVEGVYEKQYDSYEMLKEELQLPLLNTEYAEGNEKMQISYSTDKEYFSRIFVDPYILGDVREFQENPDGYGYSCMSGEEYVTPISMYISLITTDSQEANGYASGYTGIELLEQYTSAQGYQVTVLGEGEREPSEPAFYTLLFVADGIQYELEGTTSLENMKAIVDSMK